jgi:hypothetical protein
LGGTPVEDNNKEYLCAIWFNLKKLFVYKGLNNVINYCEINDTIIIQPCYEAIYNSSEFLSMQQQIMLNEHYLLIDSDRDRMQTFKNVN